MSALEKLQEKIEQWKKNSEALKAQNADLKIQLSGVASAQENNSKLVRELEIKTALCHTHENMIATLQRELQDKDEEIEKIIAQVESLLT